jgi:hypothetical protein
MPLRTALQAIELIQKVAPSVTRPEAERLAPILVNQTNNEPWYRSRVTWGALASILAGASTIIMMGVTGSFDPEQLMIAAGAIGGGTTTIWGRWASKTPIGQ